MALAVELAVLEVETVAVEVEAAFAVVVSGCLSLGNDAGTARTASTFLYNSAVDTKTW